MSTHGQGVSWVRIAVDGAVIALSILLAFGIEAWWANRQERASLAAHLGLVQAQMLSNRTYLEGEIADAQGAQAALEAAIFLISPKPSLVAPDSLFRLLNRAWALPDREVETSALERLLDLDTFDPKANPILYRHMVEYRTQAERLPRNVERFVTVKMRIADYLFSVTPIPTSFMSVPDQGEAFGIDARGLLTDAHLEGLLSEMHQRHRIRIVWSTQLLALNDSIVVGLESQGR